MHRKLLWLVACLTLILACGPAAAPSPAPPPGGASAPAASAPAASAPASDAATRQQVVDAARAEGEVNATIQTTFTQDTIARLEEAIEREYGVRLKINFTPVGNYAQRAAEWLGEVQANTTPSYDLYQSSDTTSARLREAGAAEPVNWAPLLPAGTPPEMVGPNGEYLVIYTDHFGLMYDPSVVPEAEAPRSIKDLANPRWRGKFMLFNTAPTYLPIVFQLGREPALAAFRAAMQNGASTDTLPNEFTRYAAKEYPMVVVTGSFYLTAQLRGIPARFTPLDVSTNADHQVLVARRAAHPNAAKLLAAVLAGPEGQRIQAESTGVGSRYYPDSSDARMEQEARAAGFPSFAWVDSPDKMAFALSPDGDALVRELDTILKGG
ncbi:MAG TPA: extracellular solute-binding protein [Chloroflexota bacterium]|nr:extracellular solute-binding protein [Chloroflexota bacterium]